MLKRDGQNWISVVIVFGSQSEAGGLPNINKPAKQKWHGHIRMYLVCIVTYLVCKQAPAGRYLTAAG